MYECTYVHSSTHTWLNLSQFEAAIDHEQQQRLKRKVNTSKQDHKYTNAEGIWCIIGFWLTCWWGSINRINSKGPTDLLCAVSKSLPCGLALNAPKHSSYLLTQCMNLQLFVCCSNGQQWVFNTPYKSLEVLILVLLPPTIYIHTFMRSCTWLWALVCAHQCSSSY